MYGKSQVFSFIADLTGPFWCGQLTPCLSKNIGFADCTIRMDPPVPTSWTQCFTPRYHSHFKAQYLDGLRGSIMVHSLTKKKILNSPLPLLISDW